MPVAADVDRAFAELIELRRDFHRHPELGFQEDKTSARVVEYLEALGLETRRVAGTGVVATLTGSPSDRTIMLRADMDALPIHEEADVPFRSENDGVMHACGHDAHTAMLLVAAKILVSRSEKLPGNVKFLFQPNEEVGGARETIEDGCLENPRVDAAIAIHVWTPLLTGTVAVSPGPVMASLQPFTIVVRGRGGHTGYPEQATDPVIAAADIIQTAQRIQTRDSSQFDPVALVFSSLRAGTQSNVIPDTVEIGGTLRTLATYAEGEGPARMLEKLSADVAHVHGCTREITFSRATPVTVNDEEVAGIVRAAASKIVGRDRIVEHRSMAGEDFSEIALRVPSAFAFVGTRNPAAGSVHPHHSPRFVIDEESMRTGVQLLVDSAMAWLESAPH